MELPSMQSIGSYRNKHGNPIINIWILENVAMLNNKLAESILSISMV